MGKIGGRVRHVVQVDVLDEGYRLGVYVGQFRRGYVVVGGVEEDTHPRVAGYLGDPDRAPEAPDDRRPVKLDGDVHTEVVGELGQVSYGSGHGVQRLDGDLLGAVGADDHLVGAQLFYKAGVLGVGLQVGDARVRRAEAHDLQLRAGDDGEAPRGEELPRLLHRVPVVEPVLDEVQVRFHVFEAGGGVRIRGLFE